MLVGALVGVSTKPGATTPVAAAALDRFVTGVLVAIGAQPDQAASVARVLVDADLRGVDSHGVARLPAYVRLIDLGFLDLDAVPVVERRDGATALIDARNGLGQPAGELAMAEACDLAAELGVGWAVAHHSNHFGVVGYYTRLATERGLVSFAGTNSAAVVAPTRAAGRFIGTNPLAFGAPSADGPGISLDMSTSAAAGGKLEKAIREEGPIPEGWAITPEGEHTTDPARSIVAGGALLPLGGFEELGSHKGYGLALMVEVFSSVLGSGPYGPGVGPLTSSTPKAPADISHFFVAIDPGRFGPRDGFEQRVAALSDDLRSLPPADPTLPVLVPGDPEERCRTERLATGIPVDDGVLGALDELARRAGVAPVDRVTDRSTGGGSSHV